MGSMPSTGFFHPLPVIGHPEAWYKRHIEQAEKTGDVHARASYKVGLHVTAGLNHGASVEEKFRHFRHALKHYCSPPPDSDDAVKSFYQKLCDLTRRHASHEALLAARKEHESLMKRLQSGTPREQLEEEAETFFLQLLGHERCPEWCTKDVAPQVEKLRDYWF
jgi:hypothetical protein